MSAIDPPKDPTRGLSGRAILAGLLGTAMLGVITPWADQVLRGTWIACCHLPIGAFVLFLILLGIAALLARIFRWRQLSPQERAVIYILMLVGSGIPSFGLTAYLFPTIAGAYYFATPENRWTERLFSYLPQWLFPFDVQGAVQEGSVRTAVASQSAFYALLPPSLQPAGRSLVIAFYEGLRPGQPLPWGPWLIPLVAWTFAAFVILSCFLFLSLLLRRRWIEQERLVFPLVQAPLEFIMPPQSNFKNKAQSALIRQRLLWLGAALPLCIHSLNGLHFYFPAVPEIKLIIPLRHYFTGPLWRDMGPLTIFIHFSVIGFTYLIAQELSFSFWLFYVLFILQGALYAYMGVSLKPLPGYPTPPHAALQMIGAFFMLTGTMLWGARDYWRQIWQQNWRQKAAIVEDEAVSWRTILLGLASGSGLLILWMIAAGVGASWSLLTLLFFFIFALVLTRLVSEGGLLFVQAFRPTDVIIAAAGTRILDAKNLTLLSFIQKVFMFDLRAFSLPSLMDAYKLADVSRIPLRPLLPWIAVSLLTAIISSYVAFMLMAYHLGAVRFNSWFLLVSPQQTLQFVCGYLDHPYGTSIANWMLMGSGAVFTWILAKLRSLYTWWPLHPLGYAMGPSWPMIQLWFSLFVGWLLKSLVLRYGGFRGFHAARPFFLGLVVGEFVAAGLWLLIDTISGRPGHRFFLT